MLVAVEPSADEIGARLVRALREQAQRPLKIFGAGGAAMAGEGVQSAFPIEPFSIMGVSDVLKAAPLAYRRAAEIAALARDKAADCVVFIDGWAFSRLCATRLRRRWPRATAYKFVAPQIWASRPHRVRFVKEYFDAVLCLLPFEPALFEAANVKAAFVGNPNFQAAWRARGNGAEFRKRRNLENAPTLAVMLGSRKAEVARHGPVFGEAIALLKEKRPDLRVVAAPAPAVLEQSRAAIDAWGFDVVIASAAEKYDAIAAADAALAVSGTITTEIAINGTPLAVAYKVDPLTAFVMRPKIIAKYASIINIAADEMIAPEFIQEAATPHALSEAVDGLFGAAGAAQRAQFPKILETLGVDGEDAASRAARLILDWTPIMRDPDF